jgi:Peptidase family M50
VSGTGRCCASLVWQAVALSCFPSTNPDLSKGTHIAMAIVAAFFFFLSILLHEFGHALQARREGIEINLSLLVFNLIPAQPLDGGRVLHSALWRCKGDFVWATRVAANVGRGFGYLLIAAGVAMLIFQGSFSGAWLAFLDWFLLNAATAEARYFLTQQAWDTRHVRDCQLGLDEAPVLREDEEAVDVLAELSTSRGGHALVVCARGVGRSTGFALLGVAQRGRVRKGAKN